MASSVAILADHCTSSARSDILNMANCLNKKAKDSADNIFTKMMSSPDIKKIAALIVASPSENAQFSKTIHAQASVGGTLGGLAVVVVGAIGFAELGKIAIGLAISPYIVGFVCIGIMIIGFVKIGMNANNYEGSMLSYLKDKISQIGK